MLFNELFNSYSKPITEGMLDNPGEQDSPVASAIIRRILLQRTDLLAKYGPERVGQAVDEVADFVGDVDEIGSSDVSGWIRHVEQMLGNMAEGVAEDAVDEGLGSKLAGLGLAGAMALGSAGANARVTPDGQGGYTGGLKPTATATTSDVKPAAAPASQGFSKEYLQRAADPNRTGRYMISIEKAQELLSNMQEGDISQLEKDIAAAPVKPIASMEADEKIGGRYDADEFDAMVNRLKKLAGAGPMKTVWDPARRQYRNMPTAVQPPQQPKK